MKLLTRTFQLSIFPILFATSSPAQMAGGDDYVIHGWVGPQQSSTFGWALADIGDVNGDGISDQVVGDWGWGPSLFIQDGQVLLYSGADGALLKRWFGRSDSAFGYSVANAGDVNGDGINDVIVGARLENSGGVYQSGAAYVYSGSDGSELYRWPGKKRYGYLGQIVGNAGDLDGDGYSDVFVGSHGHSYGSIEEAGAVFVYSGRTGDRIFSFRGTDDFERMGVTAANAGDTNGDGIPDLLITSHLDTQFGRVRLYSGADQSLLHDWVGPTDGDFGYAVAGIGDVNQDGYADVAISDLAHSSTKVYSGIDGNKLYELAVPQDSEGFGFRICPLADFTADGIADFAVSAPGPSYFFPHAVGKVMIHSGADGAPFRLIQYGQPGDNFGVAISGVPDVDGNSMSEILVGADRAGGVGFGNPGRVRLVGFAPYLQSSHHQISNANPEMITLSLDFPTAAADADYKVLASANGIGPTHLGTEIPLTQDAMMNRSWHGTHSSHSAAPLHGTLDANGNAEIAIQHTAGNLRGLIGRTFYLAAIALDETGMPTISSVAVPVTITP